MGSPFELISTVGEIRHINFTIKFELCKVFSTYKVNIRKYIIDRKTGKAIIHNNAGICIDIQRIDDAIRLLKEIKKEYSLIEE